MQKITPFLWFNDNAEEAANFYVSVFKNAKAKDIRRYGAGSLLSVTVEIEGQEFVAFNGGPVFTFSPAISLFVNCETQEEVDHLWEKLSEGGEQQQCGWLKDKYGVSWQIVPTALGQLLQHPDKEKAQKVMQAMMKMHKIDISVLKQAAE